MGCGDFQLNTIVKLVLGVYNGFQMMYAYSQVSNKRRATLINSYTYFTRLFCY